MTLLPARLSDVVSQDVSGETIALHPVTHVAHAMDSTTTAVWALCDGATTIEQATAELGLSNAEVEAAVGVLAEAGLVEPNGMSRRAALQRGALVAGGLAVASPLLSAILPTAFASASTLSGGTGLSGPPTERIVNGGFETGNFNGWTVVNEADSSGTWYVYSGTAGPQSGLPQAAPPGGTRAATSDQSGPGSHVLYQDVALPVGSAPQLSLTAFYNNFATFSTPASLSYQVSPNQQYRIDIIDPVAQPDPFTLVVLRNLFQTQPASDATLAPTVMTADLTAFAGQTVRLRFAEADNQGDLLSGVDKVSLLA